MLHAGAAAGLVWGPSSHAVQPAEALVSIEMLPAAHQPSDLPTPVAPKIEAPSATLPRNASAPRRSDRCRPGAPHQRCSRARQRAPDDSPRFNISVPSPELPTRFCRADPQRCANA
jgi:hypothetical protein